MQELAFLSSKTDSEKAACTGHFNTTKLIWAREIGWQNLGPAEVSAGDDRCSQTLFQAYNILPLRSTFHLGWLPRVHHLADVEVPSLLYTNKYHISPHAAKGDDQWNNPLTVGERRTQQAVEMA